KSKPKTTGRGSPKPRVPQEIRNRGSAGASAGAARDGRRPGPVVEGETGSGLARVFEGMEVLDRLLARSGAEVDGRGATSRFAAAIAEGKTAPQVIPGLFPKEPRFGGPEEAMRLYGNLFGVWDRLASGMDPESIARPVERPAAAGEEEAPPAGPPPVELPPRGSIEGREVPHEVVEGTWMLLADLAPRERTRRHDRYSNLQSELSEWARLADGLSGVGQETLELLCFEIAEMFDHAFGDRFGAVRFRTLESTSGDEADRLQPYAADYVAETLDEAEDEDEEALTSDERRKVEAHARRALVAMTAAVRES
ncbi:MAG TPA: hypothetical protein VGD74_03870, partial [Vulgatibacter sp.]